ncbi:MAG: hypothetical protein RLZZ117_1897 [Cyanobacteriota bacterium]|jgi:hypothetical protein
MIRDHPNNMTTHKGHIHAGLGIGGRTDLARVIGIIFQQLVRGGCGVSVVRRTGFPI